MKIAFRLDCGAHIGSGHLMRCTALAVEFMSMGHEVLFLCRNWVDTVCPAPVHYLSKPYIADTHGGYSFPSIEDEIEEMTALLRELRVAYLIVDHYGADNKYFSAMRPYVPCLVAIDDIARHVPETDIVLNGNLYARSSNYPTVPLSLCGPQYTLLRKCFHGVPYKEPVNRMQEIYITSGGADPFSLCKTLLLLSIGFSPDFHFHLIIGSAFEASYVYELEAMSAAANNIDMIYRADMAECMRKADLFLTASGSTLYELAACGVPSISVILAEDQRPLAEEMHTLGITHSLGWLEQLSQSRLWDALHVLSSRKVRKQMCDAGRRLIDGKGPHRAAKEIIEWEGRYGGEKLSV